MIELNNNSKTPKIILWIDYWDYLTFGLAKSIQDNYDVELYAIIDCTNKPKVFFETQKIVNFKKIWFLHDHIKTFDTHPDIDYLKKFEEKYKINLWLIAQNERIFFEFNDYYHFSEQEIMLILEQECKLYEKIIDEVEPDFLFSRVTDLQQNHIFFEFCKARSIKSLMIWNTKIGYKCVIVEEPNEELKFSKKFDNPLSLEEIQNYIKENNTFSKTLHYSKTNRSSKIQLIKSAMTFLFDNSNSSKTNFNYFGRSKIKVVFKEIIHRIKSKYRENYLNRNCLNQIPSDKPFVFFSLHYKNDRVMLIGAPFYTDEIEIIKNTVRTLPIGYDLYVKDHPAYKVYGWRKTSFYKELKKIPRVKLLHPLLNPVDVVKKSSLVISINGSTGMEAIVNDKPYIVFVPQDFSFINSVYVLKSFTDLPNAIRTMLNKKTDLDGLNHYLNYVITNTFDFGFTEYNLAVQNQLQHGGNLLDTKISEDEMQQFLKQQKSSLDSLALGFMKKINYKNNI